MVTNNQKGFSLVEMLVVVVIIGIVAAIGIPLLKKAVYSAENGSTFATIKIMLQEQMNFYSQNSRYARLDELNQRYNNNFGTMLGNELKRGKFTYTMTPTVSGGSIPPTDAELRDNFNVVATRTVDSAELPYVITVGADGEIVQVIP